MRLQATWIIPGILITLLLGLLWAMPASAADAGDISFLDGDDEISYVSIHGPAESDGFTVQIEDQDLNQPTKYIDDEDEAGRVVGTDAIDPTKFDWTNLANMDDDTSVNINDIRVFDASTGGTEDTARTGLVLDIVNGTLTGATGTQYLEFHLNERLTVGSDTSGNSQYGLVTIESSGGGENSVELQETSAPTGKFTITVEICDSLDGSCTAGQTGTTLKLPVDVAGDVITVQYRDTSPRTTRSARISLDTSNPSFNNFTPASGTAGDEKEPDLSFDAVDGESGVSDGDVDNIRIVAATLDLTVPSATRGTPLIIDLDDLSADEIADGYSVEYRLREGTRAGELEGPSDEYEIHWWAVAIDMAGNTGVSDSNSATACSYSGEALDESSGTLFGDLIAEDLKVVTDDDDDERCDAHIIRVDSVDPQLTSATTGTYYDPDLANDEGTGSLTSIVARFNENLDCDSVDADDFDVDGAAPNSVTCVGGNVYLSVDEMGTNDTPTVSVTQESVSDRAGNLIAATSDGDDQAEEAEDGIPAGLTVTITGTGAGDRPVTDGSITVSISSDERLLQRPSVEISEVVDDYGLTNVAGASGMANPTGNTNEWSFTRSLATSGAGLYNVHVSAKDRKQLTSTAGVEDFHSDTIKEGKALLFEVDTDVTNPTFLPEDEGTTDNAGIFIRANFGSEGNEYGLGTDDNDTPNDADDDTMPATTTPGEVVTDFDTHGTLTLVEATFNDDDVTADVISRDSVLFVYRPGNLSNGEHTFEITVEDNAGTEETFSATFEKIDKAAYELSLNPGPNLVSFPANPDNGDINAVFGGEGNEDITSVLTYENATGLWMTANKGADGTFSGDLTTISGMNGYWVVADGVVDVNVLLEGSGDITRPPAHIAVSKGWNLIGVIDSQQRAAGERSFAANYFTNIDAEVAYGYDSLNGLLQRISLPESLADTDLITNDSLVVETGKGYWVYANEAGIIIP